MAETTYKSAYTGAQIDKAVGAMLNTDLSDVVAQATAAAQQAGKAASEAEEALKKIEEIGGSVVADLQFDDATNLLYLVDANGNKIGNGTTMVASTAAYDGTVEVS